MEKQAKEKDGRKQYPYPSEIEGERKLMQMGEIKQPHRTLEERAKEYGGKLGPYEEFDWGEPMGRERW